MFSKIRFESKCSQDFSNHSHFLVAVMFVLSQLHLLQQIHVTKNQPSNARGTCSLPITLEPTAMPLRPKTKEIKVSSGH